MKQYLRKLLPLIAISGVAYSQGVTSDTAKIIGEISDGRESPTPKPVKLPEFNVLHQTISYKDDHNVTICRVTQPVDSSEVVSEPSLERLSGAPSDISEKEISVPLTFGVSANIVDRKASLVEWWSLDSGDLKKYQAWSNIDWSFLSGFHSFEGRGQKFTFMLFPQNISTKNLRKLRRAGHEVEIPIIPKQLPKIRKGAHYMMVSGDEPNEEAMEFIETIHELYDVEKRRLKKAYNKRVKNQKIRERELRKNPPKPDDVVIHYWKEERKPSAKK